MGKRRWLFLRVLWPAVNLGMVFTFPLFGEFALDGLEERRIAIPPLDLLRRTEWLRAVFVGDRIMGNW